MAAPDSAYNVLEMLLLTVAHQVAKFTGGHNTVANAKAYFYLDALLVQYNSDGSVKGFVGLVRVGGTNEGYHASSRLSRLRRHDNSGGTWRFLLDAGLNTMGHCAVTEVGYGGCVYQNYQRAVFYAKAAYYIAVTATFKINDSTRATLTVAAAASQSPSYSYNSRSEGERFTAEVAVTNSEGTRRMSASAAILPAITTVGCKKLSSSTQDFDSATDSRTAYIYQADWNAIQSGCAGLSIGAERSITCPKGGEAVTSLYRTGRLPAGLFGYSKTIGFRVNSSGKITAAFRPYEKVGTWIVLLSVSVNKYNASAAYPYRICVTMKYSYSGTKPNYDPPAVSINNITIRTATSSGGASQAGLVEWQTSATIPGTLSISASKTSATSGYIYCRDARLSTSYNVYVGVNSHGVVSNPGGLAISKGTAVLMISAGSSGGGGTPVNPGGGGITPVDPDDGDNPGIDKPGTGTGGITPVDPGTGTGGGDGKPIDRPGMDIGG